jgi:hypothetical protein
LPDWHHIGKTIVVDNRAFVAYNKRIGNLSGIKSVQGITVKKLLGGINIIEIGG